MGQFQSNVRRSYAAAFLGDICTDGPMRAVTGRIKAVAGGINAVGRVFGSTEPSMVEPGVVQPVVQVGGNNYFGVLANSKEYTSYGVANNPLAASITLPEGSRGDFLTMGFMMANLIKPAGVANASFTFNAPLYYISAAPAGKEGLLGSIVPGTAAADGTASPPTLATYTFTRVAGGVIQNTVTAPADNTEVMTKIKLTN